jgi:hypothetical protein
LIEVDSIIVGGAAEALPKFLKQLPPDISGLIKGRFTSAMYVNDAELVKAAYDGLNVPAA